MDMEILVQKYRRLQREHSTGSRESNDEIAFRNITIALQNAHTLEEARSTVQIYIVDCTNQDRLERYRAFLEETKEGR